MDARLECKIKANPLVNHFWMKDGRVIENTLFSPEYQNDKNIQPAMSKYEINIYNQNSIEYLTVSALNIRVS